MEQVLTVILYFSLLIHVLLMCLAGWKLWNGENVIDRLMASDLFSNLTIAVLVLTAVIREQVIFVDVALGLAAIGYITIITFAKYISDKRMF
ncbi:MAG: monovalent cation/H+ antiporter complex subunit F [Desulfobacterales bacterium]|nr:monovalent cation/H+ antiporter complex subunit F [Desulfobacterales bacterium]